MRRIIVFFGCALLIGSYSQIFTVEANDQEEALIELPSPRLYAYKFSSIPPKKFNGMNLLYYEYISSGGYYIGWYQ